MERISSFCRRNILMKVAAVIPKCLNTFSFKYRAEKIEYPFSLTFLFNCIYRVKNRQDHATLNWEGKETVKVVLMFFNFFKNIKLSEKAIFEKNNFDLVLKIPFNYESIKTELSFDR